MSQNLPQIPDPEQHWPQAEQLLDAHFRRKNRRRALILLFLLLLGGGSSLYFFNNGGKDSGQFERNAVVQEINTENSTSQTTETGSTVSETQAILPKDASATPDMEEPEASELLAPSSPAQRPVLKNANRKVLSTDPVQQDVKANTVQIEAGTIIPIGEEDTYPAEHYNHDFSTLCEEGTTDSSQSKVEAFTGISFASDIHADSVVVTTASTLAQTDQSGDTSKTSNLPLIVTTTRSSLSLILSAGPALTDAQYSASNAGSTLMRRDKEEVPDLLPEAALQVSLSRGRWDFRAGIGMSKWGETVKYSPYSRGDYLISRDEWQPYSYTVTDSDSAYIYGMLFLLTNNTTVNDSQLVSVTDTLNGVRYDPAVLQANGKTRHTLMQIPVEAVWHISRGRIGLGVSAGLTFGFLMRSTGSYLVNDESRVRSWERRSSTNMIVQASGGLEITYRLNDHFRFCLAPNTRFALTPIREPGGAEKTYRVFGVRVGVAYSIR